MNLQDLLTQLDTPIVIRPTRRMTQGELETDLDKAADILRGNADHSEFRGYVFALPFYKCISASTRRKAARAWPRAPN
ncbi:MAG: SAM-dependent DNA methyltransferase [Rubrivivax sp.]|nr:SAM-dependent DNA methyltransferase [Rubrivivax sp.]